MRHESSGDALTRTILNIIREKKPNTVSQLVVLLRERIQITENQALCKIQELESQGKIKLDPHPLSQPTTITSILKTSQSSWYWITIAISLATVLVVYAIPENLQPWSYIRNAIGAIFTFLLPGYTFMKTLYPVNVPIKTSTEYLDTVERIGLSLGMSLALVSLVGLLLNYTPWGITLTPIVLTLFTLTLSFATVAVIRENRAKNKKQI